MYKKFLLYIAFFSIIVWPEAASAMQTEIGDVNNFGEFISQTWSWASQVIFGISVVMIIVGGIMLMFANDQEGTINSAKGIIQGALVSALMVAFSAVILKMLKKPTLEYDSGAKLSDTTAAVNNIALILFGLIGGIAVLALIYSSIKLISSHGEVEQAMSAKKGIKFAIMGLIIALMAVVLQKAVIAPFI